MDGYAIAIIIAGVGILIGFLIQFRLFSKKGIIFATAAIGAVVGLSIFRGLRLKNLEGGLKRKEEELKEEEKKLDELEKLYKLSEKERLEAKKAFETERVRYKKAMLLIDAEKENLKSEKIIRTNEILEMSPEEIIKAYVEKFG